MYHLLLWQRSVLFYRRSAPLPYPQVDLLKSAFQLIPWFFENERTCLFHSGRTCLEREGLAQERRYVPRCHRVL